LLVGNHDQDTKQGDIHACYAFESVVQVMDRGNWYCFEEEMPGAPQLHVFAIPFHTDAEKIEKLLKFAETTMPSHVHTCCLAHIGVSGAKAGSNFVLISKDNISTIPLTKPGFDQVFLGHYHQHQMLTPNIRYLGSTHQHNWGDAGQSRGYWIWETDPNPKELGKVEFHEVKSAPKFVWHDANEMLSEKGHIEKCKGNFVRVKYDVAPDPDTWKWAKKELERMGARTTEQWIEPTEPATLSPEDESKYLPGVDFEDMIESFVQDSDFQHLDKELLIKIGKRILKAVQ